ncbi:hypothetical protein TNCV_1632531 [Trichonephila clavipes]|nr:hypothetical protein TNCV_1632531 [Trichonephila clavipes]
MYVVPTQVFSSSLDPGPKLRNPSPIALMILQNIAFRENLFASSISNYDCILSPFFLPYPSERNTINIIQLSDKSTNDFPVICYTDGSKIDGRIGFALVVFRSGVESEHFILVLLYCV